jgi:3-hydroxyacyl-CoA dehydrogenase
MPYLLEAVDLLDEGVSIAAIDKAASTTGCPWARWRSPIRSGSTSVWPSPTRSDPP